MEGCILESREKSEAAAKRGCSSKSVKDIEKDTNSSRCHQVMRTTWVHCELSEFRHTQERQGVTTWLKVRIQPMNLIIVMGSSGHRYQRMCQNKREPSVKCGQ